MLSPPQLSYISIHGSTFIFVHKLLVIKLHTLPDLILMTRFKSYQFCCGYIFQDAREDLLQIVFHISGWVSHIRSRPGPFSPPFPENIREILCFIFIVPHFWLQRKQWHLFSVRKLFLIQVFYQDRVTRCKRRPQFTKMVVTITVLVMGETENA